MAHRPPPHLPPQGMEDPDVTAAFAAARNGHADELEALLDANPELVESRSDPNHHHTLLIIAAWHGRTGVTMTLIERGARVNATNDEGRTALWFASCGGHVEVVRLLFKHGANPCVRKEGGSTALMAAAWTGHTEVAAYLLKKTKDPQSLLMERNRDGCSPLWFAAAHGKLSMIKLLLRKGADMLLGDQDGYPPSKVARLRNHEDCADVLENAERAYILFRQRRLFDDKCTLTNLRRELTRSRTAERRKQLTPWYVQRRLETGQALPQGEVARSNKRNAQAEALEETAGFVVRDLKRELFTELLDLLHARDGDHSHSMALALDQDQDPGE